MISAAGTISNMRPKAVYFVEIISVEEEHYQKMLLKVKDNNKTVLTLPSKQINAL